MRNRPIVLLASFVVGSVLGCASPSSDLPETTGAAELRVRSTLTLGDARARSVDVRDSVAAIGCGADGLFLVDVSKPSEPTILAHVEDLDASAVAFGTDGLVVASAAPAFGGSTRLQVVDVLDPRAPVVGAAFAVNFDVGAKLSTEGGAVAATRRRDGPLVTDEHRLELAQLRAIVADGVDDAVLLRRGLLFVHATTTRWNGEGSHRIVIAGADRGEARDTIPLSTSPPDTAALALVGDDLLCASADRVEVVTSITTAARRLGAPLPVARVRAIAVDRNSALLLADDGHHLVWVAPRPLGDWTAMAAIALDEPARDVALQGDIAFVAAEDAGLTVVELVREPTP